MHAPAEQLAIPPNARCVGCGYSLYQLEINRCLECGKAFDPADPRSMGFGEPWWRRLFLIGNLLASLHRLSTAPFSRLTYLWPWVSVGCFIVAATIPHDFLIARAVGVWILSIFLFGSIIMWGAKLGIAAELGPKQKHPRFARGAWVGVATAFGTWALITYVPITAIILFHLYHDQLDALEKRIPAMPVNYPSCDAFRVGPYHPWVGRYVHHLSVTVCQTYYLENWRSYGGPHRVEFMLRDDPAYDYKKDPSWEVDPNSWHLAGNWYASPP